MLTLWLNINISPPTLQDEFLDVLHWTKQILALACGLACGLLPFIGFQALLLCVAWHHPPA